MTRIAGINIDGRKHIDIALTAIYGIGRPKAQEICRSLKLNHEQRLDAIDQAALENLRSEIRKMVIEGDLRRRISLNIKRLVDINCYRGRRHKHKLPLRGQRTRSNANTARGARAATNLKKL